MTDTVEIPQEEYESMKATIKTLEDQEILEQIKKSEEAYQEGRSKTWKEVRDELGK